MSDTFFVTSVCLLTNFMGVTNRTLQPMSIYCGVCFCGDLLRFLSDTCVAFCAESTGNLVI